MSFESVFSKEEIYAIGKELVENGKWRLIKNGEDKYALLALRLPYEADLASNGSRVDAINKQIKSNASSATG